ncbi:MAG: DUF937 domain-containing protein [Epsilonproteobacteria bacterium]|nr:DUF937 domain-containing protein [Campylobacterota bacterium]
MDFSDLLKLGASVIQNNDDESTSNLDLDSISDALGSIFNSENGFDLSNIVSKLNDSNLGDIISSWIGDGENKAIDPEQVTELLDSEKIEEFAQKLGIDFDSAKKALADALPQVVDKATSEDSNLLGDILDKVGGVEGVLNMAKKFFG